METYFVSRYLNIYPSKQNSTILFHGVTGCIDEVDRELGYWLKANQARQTPLDGKYSSDVLDFLKRRGHVTLETPEQEWEGFKQFAGNLHKKIQEGRKTSGFLMLVASYYCNLACAYCYQNPMRAAEGKSAATVMTPELVDLIFTKVLKNLYPDVSRLSQISVNLYGGEPFLERNRHALKRILDYTQDYQMSVSAISNASSLNAFLDFFGVKTGLVRSLQISFDGAKLHHDQSRITHYGGGTFDAIIANIHRLLDRGVQINLRINTNRHNVDSLKLLQVHLEEEEILSHPNISPYAAAIHNHFNQANPEPLFSPAILTRRMEEAKLSIRTPLDKKMSRLAGIFEAEAGIPLNRTNFCMQNMPNAFLIDHRSDVYSCYEEAGNRQLAVGHFDEEGNITLNDRYQTYQSRHVGIYEPCSKCSVALTCGGGCPMAARGANWHTGTIFTNHCDSQKELVAVAIQHLFENKAGLKVKNLEQEEWAPFQPYL